MVLRARVWLLVAAVVSVAVVQTHAVAGPLPSLRLVSTATHQDYHRLAGDPVYVDPGGVWIASVGAAFELRVTRRTYNDPPTIEQVDAVTGRILRQLGPSTLDGWRGLASFMTITVTDDASNVVSEQSTTFCPDGWNLNRVNDNGPSKPHYPQFCSSGPYTRGAVWGIDNGWSVNPFSYGDNIFDGPDGHYTVTISIAPRYRKLFDVPNRASSATFDLDVTTDPDPGPTPDKAAARSGGRPYSVPTVKNPDPNTLPDLAALPAWSMQTVNDAGHDYLAFAATEWNAGPEPMVVEGYRRPGTEIMDAYQYFFSNGRPVSRARVGTMEYHHGEGHDHWHFLQFAKYSLVDAASSEVVPSQKEGFCLAPTDAINMTVPGAQWRPDQIGLSTACGDINSLWVREVLPVGWGDTYYQYLGGQSFDITTVPNGTYFVRVQVNPLHKLFERSTRNDSSLREVTLGGDPGARTVTVPPWHGIDTECGCF